MLKNRWFYYLLFALSFGFVWYLFKLGGMVNPVMSLVSTAIDVALSLAACMVTVELLLPRLFYKRRYSWFIFCLLLVLIATGSLTITLQLKLMGYSLHDYQKYITKYKEHYYYWFWSDLVLGSYFLISFIAVGGFAIRLAFDRITSASRIEILEGERSRAELEMLKNQINPHFLFNALNTIYYKIDRSNPSARLMVEQFSSLLRYQLYECNVPMVAIAQEMKFISDYIELQRERLSQRLTIRHGDLNNIAGFTIAPFVLMPLIENCFKHVSQYPDKENLIALSCSFQNGWFCLKTVNTAINNVEHEKAGIGLANIKKRLDLIYPDKHLLEIEDTGEMFTLTLKINTR